MNSIFLVVFWFWVCVTYISLNWIVKPCLPKHIFCILIRLQMLKVIYSIPYQFVVILSDAWWVCLNVYLWPVNISFKLEAIYSIAHADYFCANTCNRLIHWQIHSLLRPTSCSKGFSFTSIVLAFKSSRLLVA